MGHPIRACTAGVHKRQACLEHCTLRLCVRLQMSFARRLSGRSSREEHTNDSEADAPLSANHRGSSDQRSTHLCASPTPKSLGCCAVPMVTLVIDSNECSAAA